MERKVVLITGGAMGQGKSHALKFAEKLECKTKPIYEIPPIT